MDTSYGAAREYLLNDRSWASTGKALDRRVGTCLQRALADLAGEVPEALVPESHHVNVRAVVDSTTTAVSAKVVKTSDLKVLKLVLNASWVPKVDGTWDGLMHLEITDPDGRIRRRQSREWWYGTDDGGDPAYLVSLDRPWYDTSTTQMDFRLVQPEFFLPADATKVLSPLQVFDSSEQLVGQISSGTASYAGLPSYQQRAQGRPVDFWRGRMVQLPTPTEAPTVRSVQAAKDVANPNGGTSTYYLPWAGPVQAGAFEFCYTWSWGRREQEWGESVGGFSDPVWESAPSPVSAVFDHAVEFDTVLPDGGGPVFKSARAVVIEASNIEEMLDFVGDPEGVKVDAGTYPPTSAPLRYGRSGLKIRIYVRRLKLYEGYGPVTTFTDTRVLGAGATLPDPKIIQATHRLNRAEADGKFYLLAELDPLGRNLLLSEMSVPSYKVSTFAWIGGASSGQSNIAPDPTRQLVRSSGYYAYQYNPLPDQDYDIDARILRQPTELVNDADVVPIKQEAFSAFLELALAYMSRLDGVDTTGEMKHRQVYKALVRRFRSQHGDNQGIVENRPWGHSNPRRNLGTFADD